MKESIDNQILVPVNELELSEECKAYLSQLGICNLKGFIEMGWAAQKAEPCFSLSCFNEAVSLLRKKDLLYLMEGK